MEIERETLIVMERHREGGDYSKRWSMGGGKRRKAIIDFNFVFSMLSWSDKHQRCIMKYINIKQ